MLAAEEEILLKLMLLKAIEEETPVDELEADIVKTVDYSDNIKLPLESPFKEDD